ncbi:ABC transporter ATP-binding protein [Helicobacter jaachi]|uniref:ABC transporter ATP-binding protein n=1 Tax=Helicobacter jaachi TaxID=1677920 RepID=A0A4V6I2X4_9HELI|nr:ABC transporter ATP-binding protein [Helicobacter jaachi]TLD97822.1 ABC transporter ATP-binding protein [Helicobacter jaachi]
MLNIHQLSAHFANSNRFYLNDISLHIAKQEKLALVGESGSGKSMLAQLILRLQPNVNVQSGSITFNGRNLLHFNNEQMRSLRGKDIAYIPQEPLSSLNPLQKVGKQILESFFIHAPSLYPHLSHKALKHKAQERLLELLDSVELEARYAQCYPFELSGGQKQRVALAMSIINNPALLICDEPTTALDVLIQRQIMQLLARLSAQSAILFISHDLGIVKDFCDNVVVLKAGQVIESSSTKAIFNAPKQPYTRFLIESLQLPRKSTSFNAKGTPLLCTKHLSVGVMQRRVFRANFKELVSSVDLTLYKGQILGIAGASGSGKSSLALGLLQLLSTKGEILLEGKNVSSKALRQNIGIVFQDPFSSLSPRLRVGDIIMEGLDSIPQAKKDALKALESVGLDSNLAQCYPFELSGGQKQRVSIARAIVRKPKILILDEPTSALDKSSQKLILELLLKLQAELELGYIFITHDLEILATLSDEVMILHNGQVVECAHAQQIFSHPQSQYAKSLIGAFFNKHL